MSVDLALTTRVRGVELGRIGLGTAAFGGLYTHVEEAATTAVVERARAAGIAYFDTAPQYGHGTAERRLGLGLRAGTSDPGGAALTVSTKVGRLLRRGDGSGIFADAGDLVPVFDFSAEGIRRSLGESLERLGLDHVDIVYLHDPDDHADQAIDESYPVLHQWREEGVVGAIGVGMNQSALPTRFVRETDIDVVLLAGRHTLLDRSAEADLLPAARERGVAVVVGGVFNSGLLANPSPDAMYDYAPVPADVLERALELEALCESHGVPLKAAALQFPFREPAVATVLLGARSVAELDDNLALLGHDIPESLWEEIG